MYVFLKLVNAVIVAYMNDIPSHMKCRREGSLTPVLYDCTIYEITDAFVRFWKTATWRQLSTMTCCTDDVLRF